MSVEGATAVVVGRGQGRAIVAVLACLAVLWLSGPARAQTNPPVTVSGLAATPTELSPAGGSVQLSATVENAASCTLSSTSAIAGLPVTVDCSGGSFSAPVVLPANTGKKAQSSTLKLVAKGSGKDAATVKVTVDAPKPPSVSHFTATPVKLGSQGGSVVLSAVVENASTCTFSSSPSLPGVPKTVDCSSGAAGDTVTLPSNSNSKSKSQRYTFTLAAAGAGSTAKATATATVGTKPTGLPVIHVTGTLSANTVWSPQSASVYVVDNVTVPGFVNLTIEPGTIVKVVEGSVGVLLEGGSLDVEGTAASPVTFTSIADDSFGGDTNGDGLSNGEPNDYVAAVQAVNNSSGRATIAHAQFLFGRESLLAVDDGTYTITDSAIAAQIKLVVNFHAPALTLRRNVFAVSGGPAIIGAVANPSAIDLSGPDANVFEGTSEGNTILLGFKSTTVPADETWKVSSATGAVLVAGWPIVVKGTLILDAGTIVKSTAIPTFDVEGGSIEADGTAAAPVILTGLEDDSVGGDSTGDGPTSGWDNEVPLAVSAPMGTTGLSFAHTRFKYAEQAVSTCGPGPVTITDSSLTSIQLLGKSSCGGAPTVLLERNAFAPSDLAPAVEAAGDPSGIALSGPDANTFAGSSFNAVVELDGGAVPAGKSWKVSPGAVLVLSLPLVVNGSLTLDQGTIVKVAAGGVGFDVEGGSLAANGTAQSHVLITSLKDDSSGGDSAGDGVTNGALGDYAAAIHLGGPPSTLTDTLLDIRFATTPIT